MKFSWCCGDSFNDVVDTRGVEIGRRKDRGKPKNAPIDGGFSAEYNLGAQIGRGGFATVHLATEKSTGNEVAVKIVKRLGLDPKYEKALEQEFRILSFMAHPNIIRSYGYFHGKEYLYVVLEYLAGGELFDRIVKKGTYTEAEARSVVTVLLKAIQFCHDKDIVHRDLKPQNLLLARTDNDTEVKIADFGLAVIAPGNTIRGQIGTPDFVAPEVIQRIPYGKPADMWSMGVIVFILLGGYQPFHEEDLNLLFPKIVAADYSFPDNRWGSISDDAKNLIRGLLEPDFQKRLTAKEALEHSWLRVPTKHLSTRHIDIESLEKFQADSPSKKEQVEQHKLLIADPMSTYLISSAEEVEEEKEEDIDDLFLASITNATIVDRENYAFVGTECLEQHGTEEVKDSEPCAGNKVEGKTSRRAEPAATNQSVAASITGADVASVPEKRMSDAVMPARDPVLCK